jgi:crotonobetainyl-CoA:carnitine CoA-transferase CaiB-like acyl-CoA transferase
MSATPAVLKGPAPRLGEAGEAAWGEPSAVPEARPPDGCPPSGRLPLDGVTVLELALQYAAPFGVTLLTDLGARVIKIEPLEGEAIRRQVPQFPEAGGAKVMQGKESLALDLKTPEGVEIVHRLAARVDAIVEGFRDGAAERGRIDAATLRRINPDLVYLSARGYGVGGPCGDRAAFAPTFGAAGGIAAAQLGEIGPEDPTISLEEVSARSGQLRAASASRYASADGIAALGVATAVLLGLYVRLRGAGGQHLVSSMLLSTAHAMAGHVVAFPGSPGGMAPGPDLRGPRALYRIYDASDGWVFLAAPQAREWDRLAAVMAPYADLRSDRRFLTEADRLANDASLVEVLSRVFSERGKEDWQRDLGAADVACVAVTTGPPEDLLISEQYGRASGYITDISHPVFDTHPRLAPIVRFSRSATQAKPGCLCGDSTDAILNELGFSGDQIADLRARRVVS